MQKAKTGGSLSKSEGVLPRGPRNPYLLMSIPARPSLPLQRAHLALVHPRGSRGKVVTARATPGVGRGWDEGLVAPSSRAISEQLASANIQYQGMLRFTGRRHSRHVTGIGSAFQDFDFYKPGLPHADATADEVAGMILAAYEAAGIPRTSYIQDSGRGAYGVWLFAGMDGDALPRWQAAMKNLRGPKLDADGNVPVRRGKVDPKVAAFEQRMLPVWRMNQALGLDRGAIDPARVLRLMGTVHPKNGRMSCLVSPSAFQDIEHVDFDAWCDALMPYTRAEMRALREERAAWKAANPDQVKAAKPRRRPRAGGKWASILSDMLGLLEHRGASEFERLKMRDLWALVTATAISVTEGGCAREWAERLAPMIGLPVHEVEVSLSGVERGMLAHQAGETVDYKGAERAAFYDYSYATIVDLFDIGIEEAGEAGLRVLVPGGAIPLSAAERQRASRAARNPERDTRSGQSEERLSLGLLAFSLRRSGLTVERCAEVIGRSRTSVAKALCEAEADVEANGLPMLAQMWAIPPMVAGSEAHLKAMAAEAAIEEPGEAPEADHDVSRHIVVEDPTPAAPQAPVAAAPIPAGEVVVKVWTPDHVEYRTSTARWTITTYRDGGATWEDRIDLPLDPAARPMPLQQAPRAIDDRVYLAVRTALAADAAKDRRRGARRASPGRSPLRSGPASQAVSLAPLDVAHEARLYRASTRGS